jgi:hypothetical protein
MTNFSAPALTPGAFAVAGRPALPYTPVKSGLPSGARGTLPDVVFDEAATAGFAFVAGAPVTVTAMLFETPLRSVKVYVVVSDGVTCLLPRGVTAPTAG